MRARAGALVLALALTCVPGRAAAGAPPCRLQDPSINEASGLAAGPRARWLVTHNDSGDVARFFVVRASDCAAVSTHTLVDESGRAVKPVDIEAMARGPKGSIWLGDIGDNAAGRTDGIAVYRVPSPAIYLEGTGRGVQQRRWRRFTLLYPDGQRDAETILVHPRTGRLYVVTKEYFAAAALYVAPSRLSASRTNRLRRVARANIPLGARLPSITDGAISPSGRRLVLRGYSDAYVWEIGGAGLAAAVRARPRIIRLPREEQGEAVTWADESTIVITSEGVHPLVRRVRAARP